MDKVTIAWLECDCGCIEFYVVDTTNTTTLDDKYPKNYMKVTLQCVECGEQVQMDEDAE